MIRVNVSVMLKSDVMDPQGKAVGEALVSLGHGSVKQVRVGRSFELLLDCDSADAAAGEAKKMTEELLANMVIETYQISVEPFK